MAMVLNPPTSNANRSAALPKGESMKILKRFEDEEVWNETTQEECLDRTEGSGYWKPGSVLSMLEEGHVIHTPFARYNAAEYTRRNNDT